MNHWTKDNCKADAAKYKKRGEWSKNSHSAYSAAARNDWLDECCSHMPKPKNKVKRKPLKWHKDACLEDAKRFPSRSDWYRDSGSAYNSAKNNDWLDECCAHMPLKKGGRTTRGKISQYWDLESCKIEAQKYDFISKWKGNSGSSYQAALRNNWVEKCADHMTGRNSRIQRVCDVCKVEFNKFNTLQELKSSNPALAEIIAILGFDFEN